jgi:hypothetical protein
MTAFKLAIAALCLSATAAAAQERRVVCSDPLNPFASAPICHIEVTQGPQLKAGHTRVPSAPQRARGTANPGIEAVIDQVTIDPFVDEVKRRAGVPRWVPIGAPSPGQVFCVGSEPCSTVVNVLWPEETSRNQTTKSRATARLERERNELEEALNDPSEFPTYQSACWPRSTLEQRRCDVQQQLERSWKADDERFNQRHYDAFESGQVIDRLKTLLNDPNIDPRIRQWGQQELRAWQRSSESYMQRGIAPYAPPPSVRVPIPVPPPLKGQRPERPRPSAPSAPSQRCVSSPGSSCGVH